MRDRRNTNLSTSSTSSIDAPITALPTYQTEKRPVSECPPEPSVRPIASYRYAVYRISTLLCMLTFIVIHTLPLMLHSGGGVLSAYSRGGSRLELPVRSSHPERLDLLDGAGRCRWTISIPASAPWPLTRKQYDHLCRPHAAISESTLPLRPHGDENAYLDIEDARIAGILPNVTETIIGVCPSSLTFVVDPNEASFGKALLMLWLSYGIALTERRAFFVDDSSWVYGGLRNFFTLPSPGCKQPPKTDIVPCPSTAQHIIISSATAHWTFLPRLISQSTSWRRSADPDGKTFGLLRLGYEALFSITGEDKTYAQDRIAQLRAEAAAQQEPLVGMHIRRGDSHPFERTYSQDYLPFERYTEAARTLLQTTHTNTSSSLLLASDDPDLINSNGLMLAATPMHLKRVQDRIQLATKAALDRDSPSQPIREPGSAYVKHVDENAGWDGGFYEPLFFSLGKGQSTRNFRSQSPDQIVPSEETMRMRQLIARSYLLDLEILSHADGVVCAVSSAFCRLLAVMQGWDAVRTGWWINVDDGRPWSWDGSWG